MISLPATFLVAWAHSAWIVEASVRSTTVFVSQKARVMRHRCAHWHGPRRLLLYMQNRSQMIRTKPLVHTLRSGHANVLSAFTQQARAANIK